MCVAHGKVMEKVKFFKTIGSVFEMSLKIITFAVILNETNG